MWTIVKRYVSPDVKVWMYEGRQGTYTSRFFMWTSNNHHAQRFLSRKEALEFMNEHFKYIDSTILVEEINVDN